MARGAAVGPRPWCLRGKDLRSSFGRYQLALAACIVGSMQLSTGFGRRRAASILLAVLVGMAVVGCARGWRDKPYPNPMTGRADAGTTRVLSVQPGDSVYGVARGQGVPMRAIIEANDLNPPYVLNPGQTLVLPAQRVHTVALGETLYAISRAYGPSVAAIANANGLAPPYRIQAGQRLVIPVDSTPTPAPAYTENLATRPAPVAGAFAPGPALPSPAPQMTPLLPPEDNAGPGAVIIPPGAGLLLERPAEDPVALSQDPPQSADGVPVPQPRPDPEGGPVASVAIPPPLVGQATSPAPVPPPPPRAGDRFQWPVIGEIIVRFGGTDQGLHNDGINIAVPEGTPIRAAEAGVVAYAGNEIQGFGTLVLIKHADGWMTAYGHASRLDVRRGDTVRRGQVIARAGRTGSVDQPQLHFEIRRDAQPVDPLEHLGPPGRA